MWPRAVTARLNTITWCASPATREWQCLVAAAWYNSSVLLTLIIIKHVLNHNNNMIIKSDEHEELSVAGDRKFQQLYMVWCFCFTTVILSYETVMCGVHSHMENYKYTILNISVFPWYTGCIYEHYLFTWSFYTLRCLQSRNITMLYANHRLQNVKYKACMYVKMNFRVYILEKSLFYYFKKLWC